MASKRSESNPKIITHLKNVIPAPLLDRAKPLYRTTRRVLGRAPVRTNQQSMKGIEGIVKKNTQLRNYISSPQSSGRETSYTLPIFGSSIHLSAHSNDVGILVGAWGSTPTSRRWLNDMLVTDTRLMVDKKNRQIFTFGVADTAENAARMLADLGQLIKTLREVEERGSFDSEVHVNAYWASGVINFGDWLGPHLLRRLTGKRPIQKNRTGLPLPSLYSVGSVLQWIKRPDAEVWGSGLIRPLNSEEIQERRKLTGIRIHAVRGKVTQQHLVEKLGWDVPDVFGDPALLLPSFYLPKSSMQLAAARKIAFTPHGIHRKFFSDFIHPDVDVVNVRRDYRDVVDAIGNSRAVISTSLHGLIVAQAYRIPWVWLNVVDEPLWGSEFKFEDFFSTIDRDAVRVCEVNSTDLPNIDLQEIAMHAQIPDMQVDLSELRKSLPISAVTDIDAHNYNSALDSLSIEI